MSSTDALSHNWITEVDNPTLPQRHGQELPGPLKEQEEDHLNTKTTTAGQSLYADGVDHCSSSLFQSRGTPFTTEKLGEKRKDAINLYELNEEYKPWASVGSNKRSKVVGSQVSLNSLETHWADSEDRLFPTPPTSWTSGSSA